MLSHINGKICDIDADRLVIEAGGVGYELICSATTLKSRYDGEHIKLYTHFNLSQDSITLYGFETLEERKMFKRLIGVSKVGPKLALAILSALSVTDVAMAIVTGNDAALSSISGIGKKTAARILLELKERVSTDDMMNTGLSGESINETDMLSEAIAALVALGYDGVSAGRAVAAVGECEGIEDMIKRALRSLARKGA